MVEVILAIYVIGVPLASFGLKLCHPALDTWLAVLWPVIAVVFVAFAAFWLMVEAPARLAQAIREQSDD